MPIYLLHRYQAEAAAKLVGGVVFPLRSGRRRTGGGRARSRRRQRAALDALLKTVSPVELEVPAKLLPLLSGGQSDDPDRQFDIEIFQTAGGPVFDPLVAADTAADMTFAELLAPERLNRVAIQHGTDPSALGVGELADRLIAATFAPCDRAPGRDPPSCGGQAVLSLAAAARSQQLSPTAAAILDEVCKTWPAAWRRPKPPTPPTATSNTASPA